MQNVERDRQTVERIVNVARSRYALYKDHLPHGISQEQFIEVYLCAHRDVMEMFAVVAAQQMKGSA